VAWVASGQDGTLSWQQLIDCGLSHTTVTRWVEAARLHLHPLGLPGVYLLGHAHATPFANLAAALLHAGPGAALSDETALWWYELLAREPHRIHVCTAHHARSHGRVVVHRPRGFEVVSHRRLPLVPLAQALREFATHAADGDVRMALAEADYRGRLDLEAIRAELGRGRPGSARLRRQLARHEPRLARTKSELERLFIAVCERHAVPMPEINFLIGRMTVDAVWPAQRLAVELDGQQGHRSRAQLTRDHRRAAVCRAHGFAHARYSEDQLEQEPGLVAADVLRQLARVSAL
jgi:very-short-patch-repair endonuclease